MVGIGAIALVAWLIIRNRKDEKALKSKLNNDYPKPRDDKHEPETDALTENMH